MPLVAVAVVAVAMPPAGRSSVDLVRITIIGVVGEEALFRGPDLVTLTVTSVLFAVSHVQYDGFRVTPVFVGQFGYTLVAGVVLGWARGKMGSIAPSMLLHAAGNAVFKLSALA